MPALAAALGLWACGPTLEDLQALKEDARDCVFGDPCVLAGASDCSCASPVNERRRDEVDELAAKIDCGGVRVECAPVQNVRCENGRCTAN